MKRMNYDETMGFGRNGQSITDPIEVSMRPKNLGLGWLRRQRERCGGTSNFLERE